MNMNRIKEAAADLREAEAALANFVARDELERRVETARNAVLAAARMPGAAAEAMSEELDRSLPPETPVTAAADFREGQDEDDGGSDDAESIGLAAEEVDEPAAFEESNVAEADPKTVEAVSESISEVIDATDDEDIPETEVEPSPNGLSHLGENYPAA